MCCVEVWSSFVFVTKKLLLKLQEETSGAATSACYVTTGHLNPFHILNNLKMEKKHNVGRQRFKALKKEAVEQNCGDQTHEKWF